MKTLKKLFTILAIILVAIMAFAPAKSLADTTTTVDLTVYAPDGVNIIGKKISVYKLFDITEDSDGNVHYSWTEGSAAQGFFSSDTYFPTKKYTTVLEATEYVRTLSGTDLTLLAEKYYTYCSTIPEGSTEQRQAPDASTDAIATEAYENGAAVFTGLAKGYYLVYDVQTSTNTAKSVAILENLTKTDSIPLKIETVNVDKKADKTSANVGDNVGFTIESKVPDTTGYTTYKFIVKDTLSKGLDFNDDVTIKIGGTTYAQTITDDGKEIVRYTVTSEKEDSGNTNLVITFTSSEFLKLTADAKIEISYTATLNKDAEVAVENINEVKIEYSNNPTDSSSTGTSNTDTVKVYTYTVDFTKKNVDGTKLSGAEFILEYFVDETTTKYVKIVETTDKETGKITKVVELVDSKEDATTFTSDENGLFSITGLKAGKYKLTETKAPVVKDSEGNIIDEYVIPNFSFYFTIAETTQKVSNESDEVKVIDVTFSYVPASEAAKGYLTVTGGNTQTEENPNLKDNFEVTVLNARKGELPTTGGIGTTIFTVVGIVVMAAAVVALVAHNRKND